MQSRRFVPLLFLVLLPAALLLLDRRSSLADRNLVQGPLADPVRMLEDVRLFSEFPDGSPKSRYCYRVEMDPEQEVARARLSADAAVAGGDVRYFDFAPKALRDTEPPDTNWARAVPVRDRFRNIIVHYDGTDPLAGKFVVCAHFDATGSRTPGWQPWDQPATGADDNLSGSAAVLELNRLLAPDFADGKIPFDIDFVLFDGEEMGLWGSDTLARAERLAGADILGVLNMDMIGYNPRADSLVIMTNRSSTFLASYFQETERLDPQPGLTLITTNENLINSDHGPYWEQGYPAFMLIEALRVIRHNPQYHQVTDRVTTISRQGGMMGLAANVLLKGLRRLAQDAAGPPRYRIGDDDIVYFLNGIGEGARLAQPGDTLRVEGGVFNAGGPAPLDEIAEVRFYRVVDGLRRPLQTLDLTTLPTGAHRRLAVSMVLKPEDVGAVTIEMEIGQGSDRQVARRAIPVKGSAVGVAQHYLAPNPVRDLDRAFVCYELVRDASVRITVFDMHGDELGRTFYPFVRGSETVANTGTGLNRVPLRDLFQNEEPAPGIYLYRLEVFAEGEVEGLAMTGKFAILR